MAVRSPGGHRPAPLEPAVRGPVVRAGLHAAVRAVRVQRLAVRPLQLPVLLHVPGPGLHAVLLRRSDTPDLRCVRRAVVGRRAALAERVRRTGGGGGGIPAAGRRRGAAEAGRRERLGPRPRRARLPLQSVHPIRLVLARRRVDALPRVPPLGHRPRRAGGARTDRPLEVRRRRHPRRDLPRPRRDLVVRGPRRRRAPLGDRGGLALGNRDPCRLEDPAAPDAPAARGRRRNRSVVVRAVPAPAEHRLHLGQLRDPDEPHLDLPAGFGNVGGVPRAHPDRILLGRADPVRLSVDRVARDDHGRRRRLPAPRPRRRPPSPDEPWGGPGLRDRAHPPAVHDRGNGPALQPRGRPPPPRRSVPHPRSGVPTSSPRRTS